MRRLEITLEGPKDRKKRLKTKKAIKRNVYKINFGVKNILIEIFFSNKLFDTCISVCLVIYRLEFSGFFFS